MAQAQHWSAAPTATVESAGAYQSADIAAAPGGKLFVSGVSLRRLNADGSVDGAFNAPADNWLQPLLAYPDGRVLVQTTLSTDITITHQLQRLTSTGAIDSTFPAIDLGPGFARTAHQMPGDRILIGGTFTSLNGFQKPRICMLNADGTIVTEFQSPFGTTPAWIVSALPLPDGKIMVYGDFEDLGPNRLDYLARLNADGGIDNTFTLAGVLLLGSVTDVFRAGERLLVAGGPLWALNPDGSRDPTFLSPFDAFVPAYGPLQTDGKLVYLVEPSGTSRRELRRLNADGSPDGSFVVATEKDPPYAVVRPVLGDDGSLYVASALTAQRQAAGIRISRIRSDGTIDESYRPHLTVPAEIRAFARGGDGALFIAGDFDHVNGQPVAWGLARLRPDGAADSSFAPELSPYEYPERVWVQPNGKPIIELYQPGFPGNWFWGLVRLNADGARDASFQKVERHSTQLAFDATGRIYAAEATASGFNIVRYSADGVPDASFAAVPATSSIFAVWPDGKVAVTAQRSAVDSPISAPRRHLADGSLDASFSSTADRLPDKLLGLVSLPDGRLLAIGATSQADRSTTAYYRYTAAGAIDFLFYGKPLAENPSPLLPAHALEIAGVIHDLLRESGATAAHHHALELRLESSILKLDVGGDGKLVTDASGFSIYTKTSPNAPTFDAGPQPSIQGAGVLNMGGEMVLYASSTGVLPQTVQWNKDSVPIAGATAYHFTVTTSAAGAGSYTVTATNTFGSATSAPAPVTFNTTPAAPVVDAWSSSPVPVTHLPAQLILTNEPTTFIATASGNPVPTVHWEHNGRIVPAPVRQYIMPPIEDYELGPVSRQREIYIEAVPASTGLYTIVATNDSGTITSSPMLVGFASTAKLVGEASEVGPDTLHPSGRTIDQLLLGGPAAAFTADAGQVARLSFIDLDNDIVQVELSGAGSVALALTVSDPSGPQPPINYVQPGVSYVRGHAAIVVTGADETTNLSVFTVGRANAYNQSLFRNEIAYDGIADLAFVAILSRNGKFGSLRCANVSFFETRGFTGVYAPGVRFTGPVYLGNIEDFGARPVILLGGADADTLVCGGDLEQPNGQPVRVSGLTRLRFVDGTTSHGTLLPAQRNRARLEQDGIDVTDQIVVNPSP